jgi:hypothetical protein
VTIAAGSATFLGVRYAGVAFAAMSALSVPCASTAFPGAVDRTGTVGICEGDTSTAGAVYVRYASGVSSVVAYCASAGVSNAVTTPFDAQITSKCDSAGAMVVTTTSPETETVVVSGMVSYDFNKALCRTVDSSCTVGVADYGVISMVRLSGPGGYPYVSGPFGPTPGSKTTIITYNDEANNVNRAYDGFAVGVAPAFVVPPGPTFVLRCRADGGDLAKHGLAVVYRRNDVDTAGVLVVECAYDLFTAPTMTAVTAGVPLEAGVFAPAFDPGSGRGYVAITRAWGSSVCTARTSSAHR